MEIEGWDIIRLELKYCERCGGLWLRERGTGRVYCAVCTSEMSNYSLCSRNLSRPRLPSNRSLTLEGRHEGVRSTGCRGWGHA
jgi:hypothetical protein